MLFSSISRHSLSSSIFFSSFASYSMKMAATSSLILKPPHVSGMLKLDRSKFLKIVDLPFLRIPTKYINRIIGLKSVWNVTIFRNGKLKPVMDGQSSESKLLIFNPDTLFKTDTLKVISDIQNVINVALDLKFETMKYEFDYNRWDVKSCLRAVLPPGLEFSGYAQVGHIAHLNLREEMLPFKFTIAEILFDKIQWVKTVVNKLNAINNEFRFFEMELLAGEPNYITTVLEKGIKYHFDFSKVFWNSRLTNVHQLMIDKFDANSVVYDIFAGVGPFVLPAVKLKNAKKCYANDLNPDSIRYLKENVALNKIANNRIEAFNLDGSEFIQKVIPEKFNELAMAQDKKNTNFHAVMNLPCLAVEFLKYFKGLLSSYPNTRDYFNCHSFTVYCHLFVKASVDHPRNWFQVEAERLVKDRTGLLNLEILETHYIRKVAAFKEMFCVVFKLPADYAYSTDIKTNFDLESNSRKRDVKITEYINNTKQEDNMNAKVQRLQ